MQEEVEGQEAVDASSVGRRLAVLSDGNDFKLNGSGSVDFINMPLFKLS